ncbi:uncharacterized protein with NRDE domain [Algoriphagus boseongensis]|uniref:Uncharacterized protein with NRDE domain n=1 Tax=Algoriphagus boseongensis TaxID=1442587 RepID=A0A4R6T228_9BACT|nr:NRDE family protein [Algoriphagus boseongensis]TDQ14631.1 uncharacterized protein with NRDE domain [Algoriphagus boseongensis]
MCLVAFSWKSHEDYPLIISANRDEFFHRPTSPLHQWENWIFGGKDLLGGGTWMGFHPNGKWALVTNYRDFSRREKGTISRGKLVLDFLENEISPEAYLDQLESKKKLFDGFNLLVSDGDELFYSSNYGNGPQKIQPGIHGLSNGLLNDPWPKTELAKSQLNKLADQNPTTESLLKILKSRETFPLEALPKTGISEEKEIQLSAQLIRMEPKYGTVSASAVLRGKDGFTQLKERSFDWDFRNYSDKSFSFQP